MDNYFSNSFEIIKFDRPLIFLLSLTDPDILRRSKYTDHEVVIIKNLAFDKKHRQRTLKEYILLDQLQKQFSE